MVQAKEWIDFFCSRLSFVARELFIVAYCKVSSACPGRSFANKVLGSATAGPGTKKHCAVVAAVTSFGSHVTPTSDYLYSAFFLQ